MRTRACSPGNRWPLLHSSLGTLWMLSSRESVLIECESVLERFRVIDYRPLTGSGGMDGMSQASPQFGQSGE